MGIRSSDARIPRADEGGGMGRFAAMFGRPAFLRGFHGWMTLLWGLLIPITVFTGLKGSIIWIALMSVWANFVGHFSSWQAARVEVKQDDQVAEAVGTAKQAEQQTAHPPGWQAIRPRTAAEEAASRQTGG